MKHRSSLILVVEDDESVRLGTIAVLEQFGGYQILAADNGRLAVELFEKHADEIAVVLLDLTMPVMSGEIALNEIRRIRPDVRVVIMSGYSQDKALERYSELNTSGFLPKPFDMEDLLAKIGEALR